MTEEHIVIITVAIGFIIAGLIYIMPSIVAFRRDHPNRWVILVVNAAFGGTIIGWGVALAWALKAIHRPGSEGGGGESGLNLFINDVRKTQIVEPTPLPLAKVTQTAELERLHSLLVLGAISQNEFDGLKAKILQGYS